MTVYKTRQQIASEYGISRTTLYRRLKKIGLSLPKTLLDSYHLNKIYNSLGFPGNNSPNNKLDELMIKTKRERTK